MLRRSFHRSIRTVLGDRVGFFIRDVERCLRTGELYFLYSPTKLESWKPGMKRKKILFLELSFYNRIVFHQKIQ